MFLRRQLTVLWEGLDMCPGISISYCCLNDAILRESLELELAMRKFALFFALFEIPLILGLISLLYCSWVL